MEPPTPTRAAPAPPDDALPRCGAPPERARAGTSKFAAILADHGAPSAPLLGPPDRARPLSPRLEANEATKHLSDREADAPRPEGAAFTPPPRVLHPPLGGSVPPAEVGSSGDRASLAALADRFLHSVAVGRVGRGGHHVRLRLRGLQSEGPVQIDLLSDGATLRATVRAGAGAGPRADALAARIERELARRGVRLDALEVLVGEGVS